MRDPAELTKMLTEVPMNRRHLLQRAAVLGVSLPIVGSLLAACSVEEDDGGGDSGGTDDSDDSSDDSTDDSEDDSEDDSDSDAGTGDDEDPEDDDSSDDSGSDSDSSSDGDAQQGGRLVLMGHHPIETLHPDDDGATVEWVPINAIHEPLVNVDHNFELEMMLATDYEVSDDGMTYTITLREDVLFHDGEEFTSEDVVYMYEYYLDESNAAITTADFVSVDSVEASDDYTVVVNMTDPDASFVRRGMNATVFAAHQHEELGYDDYSTDPVGTGPFQLLEWSPDDSTLLGAFEDHWRGRPNLDEIEVRVVPEGSVRVIELESGAADSSIWMVGVDDAVRMEEEADQLGIVSYNTASTSLNHFPMNNTLDQFAEREVRQAMMYAIDRDQVINSVFAGAATKATANLAPSLEEFYNPDVTEYEFDPDQANQILDDAGWEMGDDGVREKDGVRLEWECLVLTGDEARRPEAEMVLEMLNQVGMNMQIAENPEASGPMRRGEGDMALFNWTYGGTNGEPDARVVLSSDGGNNFNHYSNEEMDELLNQGVEATDPAERVEIYNQVQELFAEEVPCLFMMYWDWFNQWNQRVKGLPSPDEVLSGSNLYNNSMLQQIWIEE